MCGDFSSDMDVLADPLAHLSVSAFILAHGGSRDGEMLFKHVMSVGVA